MNKIVLGFVGPMASGKGTAAEYINKKFQANVYRFSTSLRDVAKRMYTEETRQNLQNISTALRQALGDDILAKVIYHDTKNDAGQIVIVDGVRRIPDIVYLEKLPNFHLIYISADLKTRYERIINRSENSDDQEKTFEQFSAEQNNEAEKDIETVAKKAAFTIDNSGDFENLYKQIDTILGKLS